MLLYSWYIQNFISFSYRDFQWLTCLTTTFLFLDKQKMTWWQYSGSPGSGAWKSTCDYCAVKYEWWFISFLTFEKKREKKSFYNWKFYSINLLLKRINLRFVRLDLCETKSNSAHFSMNCFAAHTVYGFCFLFFVLLYIA